ncbi:TPR-like protein [Neoconidiobolus thromboides FSU 785]|nr:TPR-like protein [Neoconidiobolus thromboides FSU 785]
MLEEELFSIIDILKMRNNKIRKWTKGMVYQKLLTLAQIKNRKEISLILIHKFIFICSIVKNEEAALLALEIINEKGMRINEKTYTHMIQIYSNKGDLENCLKYYKRMKKEGLKPYDMTYSLLTKVYSTSGRLDEAFMIYQIMEKKGFNISKSTMNYLILGYIQAGKFDKACELFDNMRFKVYRPNILTYTIMIKACIKQKLIEKAFDLFDLMKKDRIEPDSIFMSSLILVCSSNKDYYNKALELFDQILELGLEINAHTYVALLMNARRSNDLGYARKLFAKLIDFNLNVRNIRVPLLNILDTYSTYYPLIKKENNYKRENKSLNTGEVIELLNGELPINSEEIIKEVELIMIWFISQYGANQLKHYKIKLFHSLLPVHTNYGNYERALELFDNYEYKENDLYVLNQIILLCFKFGKKEKCFNLYKIINKILRSLRSNSILSSIEKKEYMEQNCITNKLVFETYCNLINGFSNINELDLSLMILNEANKDKTINKRLKLYHFKELYINIHKYDKTHLKPIAFELIPGLKKVIMNAQR